MTVQLVFRPFRCSDGAVVFATPSSGPALIFPGRNITWPASVDLTGIDPPVLYSTPSARSLRRLL